MSVVGAIQALRVQVRRFAEGFDPALVTAADAERIVEHAAAIEKSAAAVKAAAAARVAETDVWRGQGDKSAAHKLARKSGIGVGAAREALETGKKMKELPELAGAARSGELSPQQTAAIADAASADPDAERRLIEKAKRSSLAELRDECARTKAAKTNQDEQRRRIHAGRYLRRRTTPDGAGELYYRSTLDELAQIWAVVQGFADKAFRKARAEGRHENPDAYAADGLLDMAHAAAAAAARARSGAGSDAGRDDGAQTAGDSGRSRDRDGPAAPGGPGSGPEAPGKGPVTPGAPGGPGSGPEAPGAPGSGPATAKEPESGSVSPDSPAGDPLASGGSGSDPVAPSRTGSTVDGCGTGGASASASAQELRLPPPAGEPAAPASADSGTGGKLPVPATLIFRIDWDALVRGWPIEGEMCEIAGVGPVPVSLVQEMIATGDPFLAAVVTKGIDVVSVAHLGRRHTAHQRTALAWRDPMCVVEGCGATVSLEHDHRHDWTDTKITLVAWSDRLCRHHHALKTHQGWALVPGAGKRPVVPPGHPDHPGKDPPGDPPPAACGDAGAPPSRSARTSSAAPGTAGASPGAGPDTPPARARPRAGPPPDRAPPPASLFDEDDGTAA